MNKRSSALCLLVGLLLVGCGESSIEPLGPDDDIVNHTGVIQQLESDTYVIIDDVPESGHYAPTNLPVDFRQDGLRVLFSGRTREIPPNVRMAGIPLDLSSIQRDIR